MQNLEPSIKPTVCALLDVTDPVSFSLMLHYRTADAYAKVLGLKTEKKR